MIEAQTIYGVRIPQALTSRREALDWAEHARNIFPGLRIVQHTAKGVRTIWRDERRAA